MGDVFFTTVSKVSMLLIFIGMGYLLRRTRKLPDNAGRVLSLLTTLNIENNPGLSGDDEAVMKARLALLRAVSVVIANGLDLLGVSAPESM